LKSKIILGTVQLGLAYGINNSTGKPDADVAFKILHEASKMGVEILDTADSYGDSIDIIARYTKLNGNSFQVISKFIGDKVSIVEKVDRTLSMTGVTSLYGYLYHRYSDYLSGAYVDDLKKLKDDKKIQRIGVSIYSLDELEKSLNDPAITIIQIPLNPFDLSTQKKELLVRAKDEGKEIHVRSVFLQGLFFKDPDTLSGNLKGLSNPLRKLQAMALDYKIQLRSVCLGYALLQPFVDRVLVGVETVDQLIDNIKAVCDLPDELIKEIDGLEISDEALVNPGNWKL
jgi:aryl-alcohol dehydrogenase-like predicted oxidoreductase